MPVAFGVKKLVLSCVVEDDKVIQFDTIHSSPITPQQYHQDDLGLLHGRFSGIDMMGLRGEKSRPGTFAVVVVVCTANAVD